MGSDIDISYIEKNKPRRLAHKLANPEKKIEIFTQDIHDKFSDTLFAPLRKGGGGDLLILTE